MANNINAEAQHKGSNYSTASLKTEMDAYDRLPPSLRQIIQDAPFQVSPLGLLRELRRGTKKSKLVLIYRSWIKHEQQLDTLAAYGPTHPEARK